jgi:hypothetical protein
VLRLTKGALWVEVHGEQGIDPGILLERALISALEIDVLEHPELQPALAEARDAANAAQAARRPV